MIQNYEYRDAYRYAHDERGLSVHEASQFASWSCKSDWSQLEAGLNDWERQGKREQAHVPLTIPAWY